MGWSVGGQSGEGLLQGLREGQWLGYLGCFPLPFVDPPSSPWTSSSILAAFLRFPGDSGTLPAPPPHWLSAPLSGQVGSPK